MTTLIRESTAFSCHGRARALAYNNIIIQLSDLKHVRKID